MDLVLQLLFTGIGIGAVYALVALGFVLIFRATNVVNFAQGEFSMVAAYLMVVCAVDLALPYWLSFIIALAGMAVIGVIFNLGVYYPLRHRTYLPVIIATIGASILMANGVLRYMARSRRCCRAGSIRPVSNSVRSISTTSICSSSPSRWRSSCSTGGSSNTP